MAPNLSSALLTASLGTDPVKPVVDNTIKQEWNNYLMFLDKHGLKGNTKLDEGTNSFQALEAYRKENPNTPITKEIIPAIQQEFANYRAKVLADHKLGKARLDGPNPEQTFMPGLSKLDGIPGSMTTSYAFPAERVTHDVKDSKGNVIDRKVEVKDFAATN